ncbi:hypothetical protein IP92_01471 [Pseudoduganella flava]|nr:hypothetical protein IP92_01471 [Pseudoduganella flava]
MTSLARSPRIPSARHGVPAVSRAPAPAALHAGDSAAPSRFAHDFSQVRVQRDPAQAKPEEEKKNEEDALGGGLSVVLEHIVEHEPLKAMLDPALTKLKAPFSQLSPGEKAFGIGFGAATLGMAGGAMLSDKGGRKALEGVNLAAPLALIPYVPLKKFSYTQPAGTGPDANLWKFQTSLAGDDLLNIFTKRRGLKPMALGLNLEWGVDAGSGRMVLLGGDATFSPLPGVSISAGMYKDVLQPPALFPNGSGTFMESRKSIPAMPAAPAIPDTRVMLTIDVMKFLQRSQPRAKRPEKP